MQEIYDNQIKILNEAFDEYYKKEFYEIKQISNKIECIIHYPEFYITNSSNLKHKIKDLFIKITFVNGIIRTSLEGLRTTYSKLDYVKQYNHSHLSGFQNYFNNFCLGTNTIIVNKLIDINSKETNFTKEDIVSLLVITDQKYVGWESIEGRPYKYIKNINLESTLNEIYEINLIEIYENFIENKINIKIDVIESNFVKIFNINYKDLEIKLTDYLKNNYLIIGLNDYIFCEKNEITE
ncbi:MAG: hypothetical protein ACRCRZ_03245, partial [Metamycoplasmataceae bacterium]